MIAFAAWALLAIVSIPALVLAIELVAAHFGVEPLPGADFPRTVVIMPAHDEAAGVAVAVAAALRSLPSAARLIVIADNCRDDTAARARAAGAETIERDDPARHGKSYALDFARDFLALDPPDVVIVVDADCEVDGDGIARLASAASAIDRPVQSTYLLRPRPDLGAVIGLSGFAFLLRNLVRQRALARFGAPALLTGSGMAFPWHSFVVAPLAIDDLSEDLMMGIGLARADASPAYLPEVVTWSDPASRAATVGQRRRWEQGFVRAALTEVPPLLASGRVPLIWLGLHLLVPPLALFILISLLLLALLGGLSGAGATALPFALLAGLLALLALLLLLSWARFGREQLPGRQLLLIPLYMLWKLPLYAAAILHPERRWNRTDRS